MDSFLLVFVAMFFSFAPFFEFRVASYMEYGRWARLSGRLCKRRREPIPGGLIAASMLLTLLQSLPDIHARLPLPAPIG
jgi:hypothetical protein